MFRYDGAISCMENSSPCLMWCQPPLRFLPARSMSSAVARWLHCWSPWSSQPVESCASVSQRKASDEGRRVPLLIRAALAIINRCWQELKFGTNLSHFTVQQRQIQQRGREPLRERERVSFTRPAGPPNWDLMGLLWGSPVYFGNTWSFTRCERRVTTSSEGLRWNYTVQWG